MNRSVREKLKELTDKIVIERNVQLQFDILRAFLKIHKILCIKQ